ncbi:hypothetical protein RHMOL_Rhmol13G0161600 [Rhododendron molle]|uniref:Uncharacterized protein n=1 Tax=Rhododendron molle TaxID=49168 RepID=A0ACC0L879_RHOML|nr:hypothetical protein RHMOL_Rhmol13G0161600 [Rhododendron molle]
MFLVILKNNVLLKLRCQSLRKELAVAPEVCSLPTEETLGPQGPSEVLETIVISEKSKKKQGEVCQAGIEAVNYSTLVKIASKVLGQSPMCVVKKFLFNPCFA